jgi:hypothetical protein
MRNEPALHQRFGDSDSFWSQRREDKAAALIYIIILRLSLSECAYIYVGSLDRAAVFLYLFRMPVGIVVSEGPFYRIDAKTYSSLFLLSPLAFQFFLSVHPVKDPHSKAFASILKSNNSIVA